MDKPYLDIPIYDDFGQLLRERYEKNAKVPALRFFDSNTEISISYAEMIRQIACVYFYFRREKMKGKHIAVISENRYEYIIIYLAAIFDNVIVPIEKELNPNAIANCLKDFDVDYIFCSDTTQKKIHNTDVRVFNLDQEFSNIISADDSPSDFLVEVRDCDKDRFAILLSTSGTDGRMKGVMLSQYNVITNIRGTLENNRLLNPTFAFLPMNHAYGFNPCMLATFYNGTTLCLNLEFKHLMRDIRTFDPYFFGAVPMVIEGIYDNIISEIRRRGKEKRFRFMLKISRMFLKIGIDLRHLFFGKLINPRLRLIVSGGATLNSDYVKKYEELGISILNGYGLTECSPTIAVSRSINNVPGSAGTIMNHIKVKIASDGEILVKGPCVMLGYYNDEEATKASMRDGYFATGDLGYKDGRLIYVTGRKKNLIILGDGKNVAPEYIEEMLASLPYVKECLVVARKAVRNRKVLKALVVTKEGMSAKNLPEDIKNINSLLPPYMRIAGTEVLKGDFIKTKSGKIIRGKYN